ncbi:MAG: hypothetical protein K6F86_00695 [Lachnospiraceae bacterium]|nr:hypothetical protein [Lachnospiraceae bacterium]
MSLPNVTGDTVSPGYKEDDWRFLCKGFDTYEPFKFVGGIQKGHPDEEELEAAVDFYKEISERV